MTIKHFINLILGFTIISCGSKERASDAGDGVAGSYAREYSLFVTNPQSGKELGMRTIRDTIFIQPTQEGYKISNRKWRLNDYDKEGWQNMEHAEDRPLPPYTANLVDDATLNSNQPSLIPPLYVDTSKQTVSKSKSGSAYRKVK